MWKTFVLLNFRLRRHNAFLHFLFPWCFYAFICDGQCYQPWLWMLSVQGSSVCNKRKLQQLKRRSVHGFHFLKPLTAPDGFKLSKKGIILILIIVLQFCFLFASVTFRKIFLTQCRNVVLREVIFLINAVIAVIPQSWGDRPKLLSVEKTSKHH